MKKYERIENVKIISQKNGGVSNARNTGILAAKGEYIAFVDADDYVSKDMYKEMFLEAVKIEEHFDVVCCGYYRHLLCLYKKIVPNFTNHFLDKTSVENDLLLPIMNDSNQQDTIQECWCKLYKRDLIKKNKILFPIDMEFGEDITFIAFIFSFASSVAFINKPLYHYRRFLTANTLSTKPRLDTYFQTIKWRSYLKTIANNYPKESKLYKSQISTPIGLIKRVETHASNIIRNYDVTNDKVLEALKRLFEDSTYREGLNDICDTKSTYIQKQKASVQKDNFELWLSEMEELAKQNPPPKKTLSGKLRGIISYFFK